MIQEKASKFSSVSKFYIKNVLQLERVNLNNVLLLKKKFLLLYDMLSNNNNLLYHNDWDQM